MAHVFLRKRDSWVKVTWELDGDDVKAFTVEGEGSLKPAIVLRDRATRETIRRREPGNSREDIAAIGMKLVSITTPKGHVLRVPDCTLHIGWPR